MQDWIGPLLAAPFVGSFLGVVIRRWPQGRPILLGRSACEACNTTLGPRDLVPIASYLVLRGRCRHCDAPIGGFHPAVELAALAVATSAAIALSDDAPLLWTACALGWALLALGWIDWDHMLLPDAITLPLIPAGLLATVWLMPDALAGHALGALFGYGAFRSLAWLYRRLRGRDGLGEGDAKLLAAGGAWLGVEALPMIILSAALVGLAIAGIQALLRGRLDPAMALPFGPCLACGIWLGWIG